MTFDQIVEAFESAGYAVGSYSGRGMYGTECLGVVIDNPLTMICEVIESATQNTEDVEEVLNLVSTLKDAYTDDMGLQTIVYWKSIEWED